MDSDMDMPGNMASGSTSIINEAVVRKPRYSGGTRRFVRGRRPRSTLYEDLDGQFDDQSNEEVEDASDKYDPNEDLIDYEDEESLDDKMGFSRGFDVSWFYSFIQLIVVVTMQLLTRAAINSFLRG